MDSHRPQNSTSQPPANYWMILVAAFLFFLSCVVLAVTAFFFFSRSPADQSKTTTTDQGAMLANLSRLVDLPEDEKPQVVTLSDVDALKKQMFFKRAESGDVLVLYVRNHFAVLYNVRENKIVNLSKITAVVIPPPAL